MDSAQLHSLLRQANAIGQDVGVITSYKKIGDSFMFYFYRKSGDYHRDVYLGKTQMPDQVLKRVANYAASIELSDCPNCE